MAKRKAKGPKQHKFRDRLILNQWLLTQFGINPLAEDKTRPFHKLADSLRNSRLEGLDHDNLHHFFHVLTESELFFDELNLITRAILISPNERLSKQHTTEFAESNIDASHFSKEGHNLFTSARGTERVDILEITKLADKEGPNTIATRSLGDQNLLLVDEGHRGLSSGSADNTWFRNRSSLCEKGFTFEYSATFDQAVSGTSHEDDYAKTIIFDYSYRWFYEDGFGKDYQILNLPKSFNETKAI